MLLDGRAYAALKKLRRTTSCAPKGTIGLEAGLYREFNASLPNDRENLYWYAPNSAGSGSGRADQ